MTVSAFGFVGGKILPGIGSATPIWRASQGVCGHCPKYQGTFGIFASFSQVLQCFGPSWSIKDGGFQFFCSIILVVISFLQESTVMLKSSCLGCLLKVV
jgi:hypothetical protein